MTVYFYGNKRDSESWVSVSITRLYFVEPTKTLLQLSSRAHLRTLTAAHVGASAAVCVEIKSA